VVWCWHGPLGAWSWAWEYARAGNWHEALALARIGATALAAVIAGAGAVIGGALLGRGQAKTIRCAQC
jgi:hypothetical protein